MISTSVQRKSYVYVKTFIFLFCLNLTIICVNANENRGERILSRKRKGTNKIIDSNVYKRSDRSIDWGTIGVIDPENIETGDTPSKNSLLTFSSDRILQKNKDKEGKNKNKENKDNKDKNKGKNGKISVISYAIASFSFSDLNP